MITTPCTPAALATAGPATSTCTEDTGDVDRPGDRPGFASSLPAEPSASTTGNPPTDTGAPPTATSPEPPAGNVACCIRVIPWPWVRDGTRGFALTGRTGTDRVPGKAAPEPE